MKRDSHQKSEMSIGEKMIVLISIKENNKGLYETSHSVYVHKRIFPGVKELFPLLMLFLKKLILQKKISKRSKQIIKLQKQIKHIFVFHGHNGNHFHLPMGYSTGKPTTITLQCKKKKTFFTYQEQTKHKKSAK